MSSKQLNPTFEEVLSDPRLFDGLNEYLELQCAGENLDFLRQVGIYSRLDASKKNREKMAEAIVWNFIVPGAPAEINISSSGRVALQDILFEYRASGEERDPPLNEKTFDESEAEVRTLIMPLFNAWIASGPDVLKEVKSVAVPQRPPTFHSSISNEVLSRLLREYIKERCPKELPELDFCMEALALDSKDESSEKDAEDTARDIVKKYEKKVHVDYEPGAFLGGVASAANKLEQEFQDGSKAGYTEWIASRQWTTAPSDYVRTMVCHSKGPDGKDEAPSFAETLANKSLRTVCAGLLKGCAYEQEFAFLSDAVDFADTCASAGDSKSDRTELKEKAAKLHEKYFSSESRLLKMLPDTMRKSFSHDVKSSKMCTKAFYAPGAFFYRRAVRTWFRGFSALQLWAFCDYENTSPKSQLIESMFDEKLLADVKLPPILPIADDVMANSRLMADFRSYVSTKGNDLMVFMLLEATRNHINTTKDKSKESARSIIQTCKDCYKAIVHLKSFVVEVEKLLDEEGRSTVGSHLFVGFQTKIMEETFLRYYSFWLRECKKNFSDNWTPAKEIIFPHLFRLSEAEENFSEAASKAMLISLHYASEDDFEQNEEDTELLRLEESTQGSLEPGSPMFRRPNAPGVPAYAGFAGSQANSTDGTEAHSVASSRFALSVVTTASVPGQPKGSNITLFPGIPTIEETLQSNNLRQLFSRTFLYLRLTPSEEELWNALNDFHQRFSTVRDEEILEKQTEMREAALKIIQKYGSYLRGASLLESRLERKCFVSASFFIDEEISLYRKRHATYERFLAKRGWTTFPQNII